MNTEWHVHPRIFRWICRVWKKPLLDLFSTPLNSHLPVLYRHFPILRLGLATLYEMVSLGINISCTSKRSCSLCYSFPLLPLGPCSRDLFFRSDGLANIRYNYYPFVETCCLDSFVPWIAIQHHLALGGWPQLPWQDSKSRIGLFAHRDFTRPVNSFHGRYSARSCLQRNAD